MWFRKPFLQKKSSCRHLSGTSHRCFWSLWNLFNIKINTVCIAFLIGFSTLLKPHFFLNQIEFTGCKPKHEKVLFFGSFPSAYYIFSLPNIILFCFRFSLIKLFFYCHYTSHPGIYGFMAVSVIITSSFFSSHFFLSPGEKKSGTLLMD